MSIQNTQKQNISNTQNPEKKKWADWTLQEKKESYLKYVIKEVVNGIKGGYAPFTQEQNNLPRAYNASNGLPYTSLNSLVLDLKQKECNYKQNAWISLKDAKFLGANHSELENIFEDKNCPKVQVSYIKTFEIDFVYKLDKKGQKIPSSDANGNPKIGRNGQPLYQLEMEPQKDKDGNIKINPQNNKPYMKYKTEKREVKPTLETQTLYNIEIFQSIQPDRFKSINKEQEYKNFIRHTKDFDSSKSNLIFQDLEKYLLPQTAAQISTYMKAQNNNSTYVPPVRLNDLQKKEVEESVNKILEDKGVNIEPPKSNKLESKKSKNTDKSKLHITEKTKKPNRSRGR